MLSTGSRENQRFILGIAINDLRHRTITPPPHCKPNCLFSPYYTWLPRPNVAQLTRQQCANAYQLDNASRLDVPHGPSASQHGSTVAQVEKYIRQGCGCMRLRRTHSLAFVTCTMFGTLFLGVALAVSSLPSAFGHGYVTEVSVGSQKWTGYLPYQDPYMASVAVLVSDQFVRC